MTKNQRLNRIPRKRFSRSALSGRPQLKGICLYVMLITPKKPNSARRKVARVRLSTRRIVSCYLPKERASLQEHNIVLIQGGKIQDLAAVHYSAIRGKGDFKSK